MQKFKGALFDLDGTLFDTEPQYSVFWGGIARRYHPDIPGLENIIKGTTLTYILDTFFKDDELQRVIIEQLDEFENNMEFPYVEGADSFLSDLKSHHVKCAIVTSSNQKKILSLKNKVPNFDSMFDNVLTSEMFCKSKPDPECYLKAAASFGFDLNECVVFEDSINGLKSGKKSGIYTVGLTTTKNAEEIKGLCDIVFPNFLNLTYEKMNNFLINN